MASFSRTEKQQDGQPKVARSRPCPKSIDRNGNSVDTIVSSLKRLDVDKDTVSSSEADAKEELKKSAKSPDPVRRGPENIEDCIASTPPRVADILQHVIEPNKQDLINEIHTIVRSITRHSTLKGYRLQERGSLFSPLLKHISDADIQLFSKQGIVTQTQCEQIVKYASENFFLGRIQSVRWEGTDGTKEEVPFAEFDFSASLRGRPGYSAFIVTGIYRFGSGFLIPVDLALSCGGEKSEPSQQRCAKIMQKLQEGDFAKVLQKIRALFKKGDTRDSLVGGVNQHLGRLRFVVKQLEMVLDILQEVSGRKNRRVEAATKADMSVYLQRIVGVGPTDAMTLLSDSSSSSSILMEFERELQRRALAVVQRHHAVIESKLRSAAGGAGIDAHLFLDEAKYTC